MVSRDGSISYGAAIREAFPHAVQVSDKFHLIKNLLDAISKYIKRKYPRKIKISNINDSNHGNEKVITTSRIDEKNAKRKEKDLIREDKIAAKWELMKEVKKKYENGAGIRQLEREYSMSRATIRKYLTADTPIYWCQGKKRGSKLDKYKDLIIELLSGANTHKKILAVISEQGYTGSRSNLSIYINKNIVEPDADKGHKKSLKKCEKLSKEEMLPLNNVIKCITKMNVILLMKI